VLFVGGTPLYLKSLLRGVHQGPPPDWEFRASIERELQSLPVAALHERLQVIDPLLAAKLHPHDKRRIVRGLEVFKLTGQRLSHLQTQFDEGGLASTAHVFVLSWPRPELHARIDSRVEQMFQSGLVEEVKALLQKHGTLSRTAMQAVGYREVLEHLQNPESLAFCMDRVKARTRQFARRQETWFRALSECSFVSMHSDFDPLCVAEDIIGLANQRAT
jgi:tRNA dimethylallyltransferase